LIVNAGRPEFRAACLDLLLRAVDTLADRRLGDQERPCDLGGSQAADRAQRQRQLRGVRQRRMAAQQQEDQHVVHAGHRFGIGHREPGKGVLTLSARGLVAPLIDPVRRRRPHQPSLRTPNKVRG
jgi:hypothetical protein